MEMDGSWLDLSEGTWAGVSSFSSKAARMPTGASGVRINWELVGLQTEGVMGRCRRQETSQGDKKAAISRAEPGVLARAGLPLHAHRSEWGALSVVQRPG